MLIKVDNTTFYINQNLTEVQDYLVFRNTVKNQVEAYINQNLKKPDIYIIFGCNVKRINYMSLGFMLWLSGEFANSLNIEVCNKELYDLFDVVGLTKVWNVTFNGKEVDIGK